MNEIIKHPETAPSSDIIEKVLLAGDLAKLTPQQRVSYYNETCRSLRLNPLTKPFDFIVLNGRLVMYPNRNCSDQLRNINKISLEIVSRTLDNDVLTVHVRARTPDGRIDEDFGAVNFPSTLKGEARANTELKAVTKAKRRATLSICGLGWPDETEISDIPKEAKKEFIEERIDAETGEITAVADEDNAAAREQRPRRGPGRPPKANMYKYPSQEPAAASVPAAAGEPPAAQAVTPAAGGEPPFDDADIDELPENDSEESLQAAIANAGETHARRGWNDLRGWWLSLSPEQRAKWIDTLESRWKPTARAVEAAKLQ